ncbi:MAG: elongation factor G [Bacteroidetes bacterium 4572_112]|nr:MAG: elongation factor G [Bacteroidetes bacterium 4572_112]
MKTYQSNQIKNIALVGGAKSGKTTLAEAMLFEGGSIKRRGSVDDKNTVSDYRDIELDKGNSVVSTVMSTEYGGKKINIIDTPGTASYVGEVITALNVVDTALLVVDAHEGLNVGVELGWRNTSRLNVPTVFVINQIDHEKAKYDETLAQLQNAYGDKVTVAQYPVNPGPDFDTVIDLVYMKQIKYQKGGGDAEITDIPDSEKDKANGLQQLLIEAAAEGSEELMETYFENDTLTIDQLREGIRLGIAHRKYFPVFITSAKECIGAGRLLEFIALSAPRPARSPRKTQDGSKEFNSNPDDSPVLFVFKTEVEPHVGEVAYFRVYGGEVTEGMDMINTCKGSKERLSQILVGNGKNREKISKLVAGDIGAAIKLKSVHSSDTLSSPNHKDIKLERIVYPPHKFSVAIKAKNSTDDEKMGLLLHEMHNSDPSFGVNYSRELKQLILTGMGEQHINIAKWYFDNVYHIEFDFITPKIPYRETITKSARASYKHKKQSGGSGQFGEVHMLIQPYTEGYTHPSELNVRKTEEYDLEWGGKLVLHNCIVGGAIDARFIPAILKGINERMEEGPLTGSYARDIVVYIYDGKMHAVDSNEISFKLAGRHAFSAAFKEAKPKIMEPIYDVEVFVPEEMMGSVMTDLQGRRALIMGMGAEGHYQKISAKVPLAEMDRYSTSLSSLTSGRGAFIMEYDEYKAVPSDVQKELLKKYEEESSEDDD